MNLTLDEEFIKLPDDIPHTLLKDDNDTLLKAEPFQQKKTRKPQISKIKTLTEKVIRKDS